MASELIKIVEELRGLEAEATDCVLEVRKCPKPGASTCPDDDGRIFLLAYNDGKYDCEIVIVQGERSEADAKFLAALRTHAHTLLAAAEEVGRLREALRDASGYITDVLCGDEDAHGAVYAIGGMIEKAISESEAEDGA